MEIKKIAFCSFGRKKTSVGFFLIAGVAALAVGTVELTGKRQNKHHYQFCKQLLKIVFKLTKT